MPPVFEFAWLWATFFDFLPPPENKVVNGCEAV
jgi:hypothetical protein